jgi:hypothetical protein
MDCAEGRRSAGWNGDQYVCLRYPSIRAQNAPDRMMVAVS